MDEQEQQVHDAAFEAGFGADTDGKATTPAAEAPATEVEQAVEATPPDQPEPQAEDVPSSDAEQEDDPVVFDGFKRSELRNLLAQAASVGEVKREFQQELRKAHGKIGELNGVVQELRKAPAKAPEPAEDFSHVETDYPDVAGYIKAQLGTVQQPQEKAAAPETPAQPEPEQSGISAEQAVQVAVMDQLHTGWREKQASQEFRLWIAGQPEATRQQYETTWNASELAGILTQYDKWADGRKSRQTNNSRRLEQNLTPTGSAGKTVTAPTAEDAFIAGFYS